MAMAMATDAPRLSVEVNERRDRIGTGPAEAPGRRRRLWVLGVVALAPFLVVFEDHAMAIALPSLGRDLGLGLVGLEWVVNVYTVTAAVLTLGGGMLADRFGARPVFLAGLVLFTLASLVAGLSGSGAMLIGMRAVQGAGAALMGPAALAILVTSFSGSLRGIALGVWSGVAASATASGPLLGALLTENVGWRSIFFLNVPLGVAMLIVAGITLPVSRPSCRRARADVAGVVASALGLAALIFGLTQARSYGWTSARLWAVLSVAAAAFAIFVVVERRAPSPLLDRSLFRMPNFLTADVLGLLTVAVMCSLLLFLSLYLQLAVGSSAVQAGIALLPLTVLVAVVAPLAGWLVGRAGARLLSGAGLTLVAVGLVLLGRIDSGWGPAKILPGLLLAGLGIGLSTTPITTAAMQQVPAERSGIASATLNAFGMVGMSLGIVVMSDVVAARLPVDLVGSVADPAAFAAGIGTGFMVNAALALVAAGLAVAAIRIPVTGQLPTVPARTTAEADTTEERKPVRATWRLFLPA